MFKIFKREDGSPPIESILWITIFIVAMMALVIIVKNKVSGSVKNNTDSIVEASNRAYCEGKQDGSSYEGRYIDKDNNIGYFGELTSHQTSTGEFKPLCEFNDGTVSLNYSHGVINGNKVEAVADGVVPGGAGGELIGPTYEIVDGDKDGLHYHNDALFTGMCNDKEYVDGVEQTARVAGLYDADWNLIAELTKSQIETDYGKELLINLDANFENATYAIIPDGTTKIGDQAFTDFKHLVSVTIPDSVISIGNWAFSNCEDLTSIIIPNSVISIGEAAFENCTSLTSINIPDSVTSIVRSAFSYCSGLASVTLGNSVTSIEEHTFYGCESLTSINIPDSVTSIGNYAFQNCSSLTSITLGTSVTSIGNQAFYKCTSLSTVNIPNSVTSIGYSAFSGCEDLASITIPDSVTSIGTTAFRNCTSLTSVTFVNTSSWYVGLSAGAKTTAITVTNPSTNATNLKGSSWGLKYITRA